MSKYGKDVGVIYEQLVETFRLSAAPDDDKSSSGKAIILLTSIAPFIKNTLNCVKI